MKIVYVTQRLPFGEGETFIIPEVDALLAAGHQVIIIPRASNDPVMHDDVGALLARTRRLPRPGQILGAVFQSLMRDPRRTLAAFWRLRRTRPRRRAIANTIATAEGIWVARVARSWGADHIHAHWAHLTATLAMAASRVSGIPWSFTAHRYDVVLNNLLDEKLRSACFGRFIAREIAAVARSLVSPEAMARSEVLHVGVRLPPAANGHQPARATPVLLCPARLIRVKGHPLLLEAAARVASRGIAFELWLAGDGPEADSVVRRIRDLGLERQVRMLGMLPHAALLRLYQRGEVDCVVLASLDLGAGVHEGISVALIEAMGYGIPAISTRTGGMAELLDGGAGVLVPPADSAALADALERVLGSPELRAELGQAGRRRIETEFDVATIVGALVGRFRGNRDGA
jgi:colanic acid/amylovoran biosynthesis glycosyltransferase